MSKPTTHWLDETNHQSVALARKLSVASDDFRKLTEHRRDYEAHPYRWQIERRVAYLRECLLPDLIMAYWSWADRLEDYIMRVRQIEMVLAQERLEAIAGEIRKALREIREREDALNGIENKRQQDRITPEMIEQARAYPFDQLMEFDRAGFAPCPWHEEKAASLHFNRKANRIHCFGCHKDLDTIAYLQDREGISFPEAIRRLI